MPTTVTLDDDLAAALQQRASELDVPLQRVAEDILRRGLGQPSEAAEQRAPFRIKTFSSSLKPEFAHLTPKQILDLMDDEYYEKKLRS